MTRVKKFKVLGWSALALIPIATAIILVQASQSNTGVVNTAVGQNPASLAVNPVTNKAYIANSGSGTISVLDVPTNITQTVTVGTTPVAVAVNPNTNTIYVANSGSGTVSVVNGATNTVVATVTVGTTPVALAVDPLNNFVYVANYGSADISVINGATSDSVLNGSTAATVSAGTNPTAIAVDPTNVVSATTQPTVFVANFGSGNVSDIEGATQSNPTALFVANLNVGNDPVALGLNPAQHILYVVNTFAAGQTSGSGTVSVIDEESSTLESTLAVQSAPVALAVNPVQNQIFVINSGSNSFNRIIGATRANLTGASAATAIGLPAAAGTTPVAIAVSPVTNEYYVALNTAGGSPATYNVMSFPGTVSSANVGSFPWYECLAAPYAVAVDAINNHILVADDNTTGNVSSIDAIGSLPSSTNLTVGTTPAAVAVDSATGVAYVANYGSSSVSLLLGSNSPSPATISGYTGTNPAALAVDPITNKIFVANWGSSNVSIIAGSAGTLASASQSAYVNVGNEPAAVVVDPVTENVYVANQLDGTVSYFNESTVTNASTASSISVATAGNHTPNPMALAVDATTGTVYVVNYGNYPTNGAGTVSVINEATNTITNTVTVGNEPVSVALDPNTHNVYVANEYDGTVAVIAGAAASGGSASLAATVTVGNLTTASDPPTQIVGVNPQTQTVYVADEGDGTVSYFSESSLPSGAAPTITVGTNPHALTINPATNKIYTANYGSNNVSEIDGISNQAVPWTAGTNPYAIVVNPTATLSPQLGATYVYVANHGTNTVTLLNDQYVPLASVQEIALTASITALSGNSTTNATPTINFTATSAFSPNKSQPDNLLYQLDSWQGTWTAASVTSTGTNTASFSATLPTLTPGVHILYAYSTDGQDATSAMGSPSKGSGDSPLISDIVSYTFLYAPPAVAGQTITFNPLSNVTYGAAPFNISATDSASLQVTFTSTTTSVCTLSNPTFSAPATTETVTILQTGECSITASQAGNGSYGAASPVSQSFQVTPATLTVTASPTASSMVYGGTPPPVAPGYSGFQYSDNSTTVFGGTPPTCTFGATSSSPVGPYSATCTGPSAETNYTISYVAAPVSVTQAAASVTPNAATKIYGTADPTFTGTLSGFLPSDSVTATYTRTAGNTVGNYTISATLSPSGVLSNYNITYNTAQFSITPAPLNVTASSPTVNYGVAVPGITASYATFVNGDTATNLTTAPTCSVQSLPANNPAGSYTTSCTGAADSNYTITYTAGTLTISAVPLVITASSGSFPYGSAPPAITASFGGFTNGDSYASLTTQPTCSTSASNASTVAGGPYPSTCMGAADSNYVISYVPGAITVTAISPTVAAVGGTFTYNGNPECASATALGLSNVTVAGGFAFTYSNGSYGPSSTCPTAPGTYAVSVLFTSTDPDYTNGSASTSIIVNQAVANVAVTSTEDPSNFGDSVSFTANVTSAAGTPTGSVQFVVDGANFGAPASLTSGSATSTATTSLPAGEHVVTAIYSGDTDFLGSTSPFLIQSVNNPLAAIAVTPASQTIFVTGTQQYAATGTFADTTSAILPTGGTFAVGANTMTSGVSSPMAVNGGNGMLYYLGGQDSSGAESYVQTYTPSTGTWGMVSTTPALTARFGGVAVQMGGTIYVIGGSTAPGAPSSVVESLTLANNSVATLAPLGHPSGCSVGGAINGLIYVLSGCDGSSSYAKDFDVYNPATNTWTSLSTLPSFGHNGGAAGVMGGKLYVAGGYDTTGSLTANTEVYDPQLNTWTTLAPMPVALGGLAGAVIPGSSDSLYVVGGADSSSVLYSDVYVYTVGSGWSTASAALSAASSNLGLVAFDGELFAAGGATSASPNSNAIETVDTDDVTWASDTTSVATIDPNAGLAAGVSAGTANVSATSAEYSVTGSTPLTVEKQSQTISFGPLSPVTYGAAPFGISATDSASLQVSFTTTTPTVCSVATGALSGNATAGTVTILAAGNCSITANQGGNADYNPAVPVSADFTVNTASLTITASSGTMTYGGTAPTITASYATFVNGDTASSLSTAPTCTTAATSSSHVGSSPYASSCSGAADPNYTITYTNGQVTVTPATLTVTASSGSFTYGSAPPTITGSGSGFVNGDSISSLAGLTCSTTATNASHVSGNPYKSTCSGGSDGDYSISYINGTVTVNPAPLTVTASTASMTYGGTVPTITGSSSGFVNGDTIASLTGLSCSTTATSSSHVVGSPYASTCTGGTDSDYTISYVAGQVTVNPAPLTVTASTASMTYGGTVPTITGSSSGFVNGDTIGSLTGLSCSTTATAASHVAGSPYASTCTGGTDSDYTITFAPGQVTVNPAPLTVTASTASMTYGGTVPTITGSSSGFVNGDSIASLTGLTCSTTATSSSHVAGSPYASTCAGGTDSDYSIGYIAGNVTVNPASLTIAASSGSMTYGGTAPTITASYSGFVNGDSASSLTGLTCSTTANSTSPVSGGPYPSSCSGATDSDYTIGYTNGSVTVNPASVVVTASSPTMTYAGTVPTITPSYSAFVNGQNSSVVSGTTCSTTATSSSNVGNYPSSCSGSTAANYTFTYVNGSVTVNAEPVTITASNTTMTYGSTAPTPSALYTYGSLTLSATAPAGLSAPTCVTTATSSTPVGTDSGANTCSAASGSNYSISYAAGNVTVSAEPVTITASNTTMTYGGTAPTPSALYTYGSLTLSATAPAGLTAPTCVTTATSSTPVGTDTGANTCSAASGSNYSISYAAGNLTVSAEPVTITASNTTMTYGSTAPTPSALYTYGSLTLSATAPAGLTAPTCVTSATSSTPVGTDSSANTCSAASGSNYSISYAAGNVTVSAEPVTITASNTTMTYGGTAPTPSALYTYGSLTLSATAPAGLTAPTCVTTATSSTPVGTDTGANTCGGASGSNFSISYVAGNATVTPATLTITAGSPTVLFGITLPTITATYTYGSVTNSNTPPAGLSGLTCSTTATLLSLVGSYPTSCTGATDSNYTIVYVPGTLSITVTPLTITASNQSFTYGSTPSPVTPSYSGFASGNNSSNLTTQPTCTTTATSTTAPGTYASNCAGAVDPNYAISYVPGTVTENPAALVVTAPSSSTVYGTPATVGTPSYSGFQNGQNAGNLTAAASCSTTDTSSSVVGSYPVSCSGASSPDYSISYTAGSVSVTPAPLTITAPNVSISAGSALPALTASVSGLVLGQTSSVLGTISCSVPSIANTNTAGSYPVVCGGASDSNYAITYVGGSLTITGSVNTGLPIASVSPGCVSFGGVLVGTQCASNQPVTITNIGSANLVITSVADSGPNAGDFTESTGCVTTLAPGASCTVNVSFKPSTVGPETATLIITDNSNGVTGSTQTVGLNGAGVSQIQSNFNGTSVNAGNYVWFNSVFSPKNLPSSGSVTVSVSNVQATFTANGTSYTVPLPNAIITMSSSVTVATTTFDSTNNRWVTLTPLSGYSGNLFLDAGAYQVPAGGLPGGIQNVNWSASFATDSPGVSLNWQWAAAVYSNCTTNYNQLCVKPVDDNHCSHYQNSDHAGTCEGNSSSGTCYKNYCTGGATGGGGSNCTGSYSGTGTCTPPKGTLTVVNCTTFPTTSVGSSSTETVTLVNNSSSTVTGITFATTGPYTVSGTTCGSSLAAGSTCTVTVTYTPTSIGTQTGTLTITDSAGTQTVNLAGNITTALTPIPGPVAQVTPTCLSFTGLIQGDCQQYGQQPSAPQTVTVTNVGTATSNLNITNVTLTGAQASDFSFVNNCPTNLAAGASCTISVSFSPQTVGPAVASLVITDNSNDTTGSTQSVSLNGAGQTQLQSSFNENWVGGTHYVWFNSNMQPQNINSNQTTNFFMTNGVVTFTENNQNYSVAVPDCIVTFSPNVNQATTTFDSVNNRWVTIAPSSSWGNYGNTFLSAVAYQVPDAGLPGSITNVTWTAAFSTDTPGAALTWQWGAAPYESLPNQTDQYGNSSCNYNSCNTKPVDGGGYCQYNDKENCGTPEGYQSYCYAGATCDGVSNHTGNYCNPGGPTCKLGPVYAPTCVTAPSTSCGQTCTPVPIQICNRGSMPITISQVNCSGDFQVCNNVVGTTLQPGQSCYVNIQFCPSKKGTRCGTLSVCDNTTNTPHTVCLTGAGQ